MSDRDSSNSFMWFLAGRVTGVQTCALPISRSGRETRDAIRNTANEGKEYIKKQSREARDAVGQWVDRGKEVIGRQKDQFASAFEAGRQAYHEATGEAKKP